jgi:hypothetical protein
VAGVACAVGGRTVTGGGRAGRGQLRGHRCARPATLRPRHRHTDSDFNLGEAEIRNPASPDVSWAHGIRTRPGYRLGYFESRRPGRGMPSAITCAGYRRMFFY